VTVCFIDAIISCKPTIYTDHQNNAMTDRRITLSSMIPSPARDELTDNSISQSILQNMRGASMSIAREQAALSWIVKTAPRGSGRAGARPGSTGANR
jgi:hypothetical protein